MRLLQSAHRQDPDNEYFLTQLISLCRRTEQWAKERDYLQRRRRQQPGDIDVHLALGKVTSRLRDYPAAAKIFLEVLSVFPEHIDAITSLGNTYLHQNRVDEAQEVLERGYQKNPGHTKTVNILSRVYQRQGKLDEAIAILEDVIANKRADNHTRNNLATFYIERFEFKKAEPLTREVLMVDPTNEVALGLIARSFRGQKKEHSAQAYFRDLKKKYPKNALIVCLLAASLIRTGKGEEAENILSLAQTLDSSRHSVLNLLGLAYLSQGKMESAKKVLMEKLAKEAENSATLDLLGQVYHMSGDAENAEATWAKIRALNHSEEETKPQDKSSPARAPVNDKEIRLPNAGVRDPSQAERTYQEGASLLRKGKLADAAAVLEKGFLENPEHVGLMTALAGCHVRSGKVTEGLALLKKAYALDPQRAETAQELGQAYLKANQFEAFEQLEERVPVDLRESVSWLYLSAKNAVAQRSYTDAAAKAELALKADGGMTSPEVGKVALIYMTHAEVQEQSIHRQLRETFGLVAYENLWKRACSVKARLPKIVSGPKTKTRRLAMPG